MERGSTLLEHPQGSLVLLGQVPLTLGLVCPLGKTRTESHWWSALETQACSSPRGLQRFPGKVPPAPPPQLESINSASPGT